jgi:GTP cyclohydrolase II
MDESGEADDLPNVGDRVERDDCWIEVYARAHLPSELGNFEILVLRSSCDDKEHVALVRGSVRGARGVPVRIHSECLTGDVLGSLRCDCREQLLRALSDLGRANRGVLLYLRQEGRGIGLGNKIRAYALQESGMDTFAANRHLGFDDDLRDYTVATLALDLLGVAAIRLVTNNPRKLFAVRQGGIEVESRVPVVGTPNPHNREYLQAKELSGHLF